MCGGNAISNKYHLNLFRFQTLGAATTKACSPLLIVAIPGCVEPILVE